VIDGENPVPLSWSNQTYKNKNGEKCYMGVIKAETNQKWSEKTALIWHMNGLWKKCSLYVTASPNGPRDLKIERSIDGGKNYKTITTVTLKNTGQVQDIFQNVPSAEDTVDFNFSEYTEGNEVYRISVASDYKLDGSLGLYESNSGELVINKVAAYKYFVDEQKVFTSQVRATAYKIADKKVKINWDKVDNAKEYVIYKREYLKGNTKKVKIIKATNEKECSYIVKNLDSKKKYIFVVKAILENGETDDGGIVVDMKKQLIPKDIKLAKKIKLKKGKKKRIPLKYKKGTDKSFVKEIKYTVNKKKVIKIKNNKIVAKKKGTALVKVKIVLKSGLKKTLKTKVIVK